MTPRFAIFACLSLPFAIACAASGEGDDGAIDPNGGAHDAGSSGDAGSLEAVANDAGSDGGDDGTPIDDAPWTAAASFDAGAYGDGDGGVLAQGEIGESCKAWMARVHPEAASFKADYAFVQGGSFPDRRGRAGRACAYVTYFNARQDSYSCGFANSDVAPAGALFGARPVAFCSTGPTAGGELSNATSFTTVHVSTSEGVPPLEQGWKNAVGQSDAGENCRAWLVRTGQTTAASDGTIATRVVVDGLVSMWPLCATLDTTYAATPSIGNVCSTGAGPFGEKNYFAIGACSLPASSPEGAIANLTQTRSP